MDPNNIEQVLSVMRTYYATLPQTIIKNVTTGETYDAVGRPLQTQNDSLEPASAPKTLEETLLEHSGWAGHQVG